MEYFNGLIDKSTENRFSIYFLSLINLNFYFYSNIYGTEFRFSKINECLVFNYYLLIYKLKQSNVHCSFPSCVHQTKD